MKIYIIRHGETNLNALGVMQGCLDEPLNETGKKLAVITGQRMKGIRIDYCISSPLIRAVETCKIILRESGNQGVKVTTDDRIREIDFGDIEGKQLSEMGKKGELFFSDPFDFEGFPNGERIQDVCVRTQSFLKNLIKRDDDKTYLLGVHGCCLRAMLNFLYDNQSDYWHGHVPYNCAINIIEVENGKAQLIADDVVYYDESFIIDRYRNDKEQ